MNDAQNILWSMFRRVITYLDTVIDQLTKPAAIAVAFNKFKGTVQQIESLDSTKGDIKSGKTKSKNDLRDALEESTFEIASVLHSYAVDKKLPELMESTKLTDSELDAMRESAVYTTAVNINKLAVANTAAIEDSELTPGEITDHLAAAESYKAAIGETGTSFDASKNATTRENELFSAAGHILADELDVHMRTVRRKKPEIYARYDAARTKKLTGIRHEDQPQEDTSPES